MAIQCLAACYDYDYDVAAPTDLTPTDPTPTDPPSTLKLMKGYNLQTMTACSAGYFEVLSVSRWTRASR